MVNFYTHSDYQEQVNKFRSISNAEIKGLWKKDAGRLHIGVLSSLGLDHDTAARFFVYLDKLINSAEENICSKIADEFKEKFIDNYYQINYNLVNNKIRLNLDPESVLVEDDNDPRLEDTAEFTQSEEYKPREDWSEAQKTHFACGILRYIYDLNQSRLLATQPSKIPLVNFSDTSGTQWHSATVSLTGTHTHGVNSDAVLTHKTNRPNSILAAVADGVTNHNHPEYPAKTAAQSLIQSLTKLTGDQIPDMNQLELDLKQEVIEKHTGDEKITAASTLSYALDRGDKIDFVAKGDSPIVVFGNDSEVVWQTKDNGAGLSDTPSVSRCNNSISIDSRNQSNNYFTCTKSAIKAFAVMSDGIVKHEDLDKFVVYIKSRGGLTSPQAFTSAALDYSNLKQSTDDRSIQVVMKV